MPKISYIIPVYNAEQWLPRVAQCLKNQTDPDFEAILVNDGSTDSSGHFCAELAAEDQRFFYFEQPNCGVAAARNTALDAAAGQYICFLDADDFLEPDATCLLYHTAAASGADVVLFELYLDHCNASGQLLHREIAPLPMQPGVYRGNPFKTHFEALGSLFLVAGKLIRRQFLQQNGLHFARKQLGEDGLFYVELYRHDPHCLILLDRPLYHYTLGTSHSLSSSYHPERLQDNFYLSDAVWDVLTQWHLQASPPHLRKACCCTVRDLMLGIKNLSLSPLSFRQRRRWLRAAMQRPRTRQAVRQTRLDQLSSTNDRIKLLLLKLHGYSLVLLLSQANRSLTAWRYHGHS